MKTYTSSSRRRKHSQHALIETYYSFNQNIPQEKKGGKITQPKEEVHGVGWIAAAEDPEDSQFALLQPIHI